MQIKIESIYTQKPITIDVESTDTITKVMEKVEKGIQKTVPSPSLTSRFFLKSEDAVFNRKYLTLADYHVKDSDTLILTVDTSS